jgi:hypothetical protein
LKLRSLKRRFWEEHLDALPSVTQFSEILNIIIPFFDPVQGAKSLDYADFCRVALLMKDKAHLTVEGLNQIKNIKSGMNSKRDHVSS